MLYGLASKRRNKAIAPYGPTTSLAFAARAAPVAQSAWARKSSC